MNGKRPPEARGTPQLCTGNEQSLTGASPSSALLNHLLPLDKSDGTSPNPHLMTLSPRSICVGAEGLKGGGGGLDIRWKCGEMCNFYSEL